MTDKSEILFWRKAIEIIEKGYGKQHAKKHGKEFSPVCGACQASWVVGWILGHIALMKWWIKK